MKDLTLFSSTSTSDSELSQKSNALKAIGRWTKEEHQKFIEGLRKFGRNWKLVEEYIGTRDSAQIRSHAQKFFNRLEREFNCKVDKKTKNLEEDIQPQKSIRKYSDTSLSTYNSSTDNISEENNIEDIPKTTYIPSPVVPKGSMFHLIFGEILQPENTNTKLADLVQMQLDAPLTSPISQASFKLVSKDPNVTKKLSLLRRPNLPYETICKKIKVNQ